MDDNQTWVLLHYTDYQLGEIRMELSRPTAIGSDDKISEWSERIILGSIPLDGDQVEIEPPDESTSDHFVRRKITGRYVQPGAIDLARKRRGMKMRDLR